MQYLKQNTNMQNKEKFSDFENPMEALAAFTQMMGNGSFYNIFGGMFEEKEKYPYERLGDGYELRPIELTEEESKDHHTANSNYCHLYHNDLKVSDLIFRKGGTGGKFKDGYCELIHYVRTKEPKKNDSGFSFGTHVIINHLGEIVLKGGSFSSDYPCHIGGHLAYIGNYIYDLRSGKAIAPKSSTTIKGANNIIIEHRYHWYDKEVTLPLGIYSIDFQTAELIKLDEVK
jgi:hypothetical protein